MSGPTQCPGCRKPWLTLESRKKLALEELNDCVEDEAYPRAAVDAVAYVVRLMHGICTDCWHSGVALFVLRQLLG